MGSSRSCPLLVAALIFMHNMSQATSQLLHSRLVPLSDSDGSSCHECLVISAGFQKIYLRQVGYRFRLYWLEGYGDILPSILLHCHSRRKCLIYTGLPSHYDIGHLVMTTSQYTTNVNRDENIEQDVFLLAQWISHGIVMPRAIKGSVYDKHDLSRFMRKKKTGIPLLPGEYSKRKVREKRRKTILQVVTEEELISTTETPYIDPSIRCMIIHGPTNDGVCRECLAMHSKWFTVRGYLLFYKQRQLSAELLVFPSNYETSDIKSNCLQHLCSTIVSWDPKDCQIMDFIFPTHHGLIKKKQKEHDSNELHLTRNENAMDMKRIKRVLDFIAQRRMPRKSKYRGPSQDAFTFPKTLGMLRQKKIFCIYVTASVLNRWPCIGCILKKMVGARLVLLSSLWNAIVLTSQIEEKLNCATCSDVTVLRPDACKQFRGDDAVNIEVYPSPSDHQLLQPSKSNCIVLYYTSSNEESCVKCIKRYLPTTGDPYVLTKTSSLLDVSKVFLKRTKRPFQNLLECHTMYFCIRLQMVPYEFCMYHEVFVSQGDSQSVVRAESIEFTQERIPVGVWPSQEHRIVMSDSESERAPELWPVFANSIALVQFEYKGSTFLDCAACLLERTDVFFAYNFQSTSAGYVWMRQAPSFVLRSCVGKGCSGLSYDAHQMQLERPVGIRQMIKEDIRILREPKE